MVAAAIALAACNSQPGQSLPVAVAGAGPQEVLSLLADNELVLIPSGGSGIKWQVRLAPAPDISATHGYVGTGHYLALQNRGDLYVLPPDSYHGGSRLLTVDWRTGKIKQTTTLPDGAIYGSLAVGPRTGRVFLVGQRAKQLLVTVFDPTRGAVTDTWVVRDMSHWKQQGPVGGDFSIYQATVTQDENRLYYSYIGGLLPIAGLDWVDFIGSAARSCPPPRTDSACLPGLAGFQLYQGDVLLTTGIDTQDGVISRFSVDGKRLNEFHLKLGVGFLEDFALDAAAGRIYAIGSCGYVGGFSVLDIRTGVSTLLAPTQVGRVNQVPCGQRLELNGSNELVVGSVHALLAQPGIPGRLLFISPKTGKVDREVTTTAEPLDVLVLR